VTDTPQNETGAPPPSDVSLISITDEMRKSYLDYAMSVIVSRALPDVRDGLKPVHRRILFSMSENGYEYNKPYRKSARVVGDVIGKYHPHGDSAVYMALVRMAQDFSMGELLVEGQGNFGSVDGDMPAAMRYTEVRMQKITNAMLDDLDKDTVNFRDNYDGSEHEPTVLPARFPNMLVNGGSGIAVGMATNIPTHNLAETIDAALLMLDNPSVLTEELMEVLPGPDFPTAGIILGRAGIRAAYETGRGSIMVRGRVAVEEIRKEREALIITELPYQVNKATLVEKIAELVREKRVEGIADMRDESSREGMRVVIEIKRDALADVVLNQLYRFTQLQSSFGCNFVALNGGKPQLMNLREILGAFIDFRHEVVTRRARYLLNKARDRAHILVGLAVAVANIDEVIALIRTAPDPATAREQLMTRRWPAQDVAPLIALIDDPRHRINEDGTFNLSEEQARAILELRLARLTALGRDEIGDELNGLGAEIEDYLAILRSRERVVEIIRQELVEIKEQFAGPRRTEISDVVGDFDDEDLIAREDMVVTVTHGGYIKRVPLSTYRAQNRGGKGRSGMATRDEDFVSRLFVANTHTPILFFTSAGIVYKLKVWRLPLAQANARGKALINILPLEQGERITSIMPMPEDEETWKDLDIMFATTRGTVRRNSLADFVEVRQNGKIAMKLDEGDQIVGVDTATASNDVLLTTAMGQAIRFPVDDVRVFKGRDSMGVRGISLAEDDVVISMAIVHHFEITPEERAAYRKARRAVAGESGPDLADEDDVQAGELPPDRYAIVDAANQMILAISERGYGKRTPLHEFRITNRGGKGIVAMAVNDRNGKLVASFPVADDDQIMLITDGGQTIRMPVEGKDPIRVVWSRGSQGVRVFDTGTEKVMAVEHISEPEGDEDELPDVPDAPDGPDAPATE
jgi:DNA gyrase subunit A